MPSAEQRREIAREYCRRVSGGDVEGIVALFAADAAIQDPVGSGSITGHEELRGFFGAVVAEYQPRIEPGEPTVPDDGTSVALPITVRALAADRSSTIRSIDVFTIDQSGLIAEMRAFWGRSDVDTDRQEAP